MSEKKKERKNQRKMKKRQ